MVRTIGRFVALGGILMLPLAACQDNDDIAGPNGQASVSVLITDDPGDFTAAVVSISSVELLGSAGEGVDGDNMVLLTDEPWTGNLLDLQNEVDALVSGVAIPDGTYRQIRLIIPDACIAMEAEEGPDEVYSTSEDFTECGDVTGTLQTTSLGTSGLKLLLPGGGMEITNSETLLMDFLVDESFSAHQAGRSGRWILNPVVRVESVDMTQMTSFQVNVGLDTGITLPTGVALENLRVQLDDATPVALDASGQASFGFVAPGTHTLTVLGPDGSSLVLTTDPASPFDVDVASDGSTVVNVTITGVS